MDEWDQREQGRLSRKPSAYLRKSRVLLTYVTVILTLLGIALTFVSTNDLHFLSPGPLISAHGTIEDCAACHTQSKPGKFGWLQRIRHDDRTEDVQACIKCHKVRGDVTFAHAAQKSELEAAQRRSLKFSSRSRPNCGTSCSRRCVVA